MVINGAMRTSKTVSGSIKQQKQVTGQLSHSASIVMQKVDDELSTDSTNPVQNKVVTAALDQKQDSESLEKASVVDVMNLFR